MTRSLIERFEEKYFMEPNSGCWIWLFHLNKDGYGNFRTPEKWVRAHRWSYEYYKGPIGDLYVLHKCDTPCCVNPNHLFLGTQKDNMQDCKNKGRQTRCFGDTNGSTKHPETKPRGTDNKAAKLTDAEVVAIFQSTLTYEKCAKKFGVCKNTVINIRKKKNWKHITKDL